MQRALTSTRAAVDWLTLRGATALASDSRAVRPGCAFIAWPGQAHDARAYVADALARGAPACLLESEGVEAFGLADDERLATVQGLKAATGPIASLFMAEPSRSVRVVACTGTNGKTSTTWWIAQASTALGMRCGVIGTLGIGEPPRVPSRLGPRPQADSRAAAAESASAVAGTHLPIVANGLTTPDPVLLQDALRNFRAAGVGGAALEASSIGIAEDRLAGTHIEVALFTNFTLDHLDYHGDLEAYWEAKARLFDWPGLKAAVVNVDDPQGLALAQSLAGGRLDLWSVAAREPARLRALAVRHDAAGLAFEVHEGAHSAPVETALLGHYNVANLLGVIAVLRAFGYSLAAAAEACGALTPVPGRMQRVADGEPGPQVVIDYAHTPDALDKALAALRPFAVAQGGRLWCVFGCGGDRDAAKRPLMGAIAVQLADHVVVTSDNPRGESPDFIISQILAGCLGHDEIDVIENRAEAIGHAVADAGEHDIILLAGKGHEDYQEIAGVRHPFADHTVAIAALETRRRRSQADAQIADGKQEAVSP